MIHTLSVLIENRPGALARVSNMFARRGYNIESLAVGPTEHPDISRMTIVVGVDELPLEQVTKQLNKLINVIKIVELEPTTAVQRELLLVKVRADATVRSQVLETVQLFRAKVVDVATDTLTLELFQATKSANHFNFYAENTHGSAFMHEIEVQAKGNVECLDTTSKVIACPSGFDSGTKAAIGKRTVVIENVNNFGTY